MAAAPSVPDPSQETSIGMSKSIMVFIYSIITISQGTGIMKPFDRTRLGSYHECGPSGPETAGGNVRAGARRGMDIFRKLVPAAALLVAAACARSPFERGIIEIGVLEPLTGAFAAGGNLEASGIRLANELYPTVTLDGKEYRIRLVMADNKSDRAESAKAAARLAERKGMAAILGSWDSSLSMAAGPVVKEAGIPAIGLSCTNPLVTMGNRYYFRVCYTDAFQGRVMADYARGELGASTAVVVRDLGSDYSTGLAEFFSAAFTGLAGNPNAVVASLAYARGDRDFSQIVETLLAKEPDVVFAPGNYTESALLITQARAAGVRAAFLGGDAWETPEFLDLGKAAVEGAAFSSAYAADAPQNHAGSMFLEEYRSRYGLDPVAVTALGFDGYLLVLSAIRRAGSAEPYRIRDELALTAEFEGATGTVSLDGNGDAVKGAVIKAVRGGTFTWIASAVP